MTRETKIGLLVGLAFIIVIGILLSDHLTQSTEPPQATLAVAGNSVRSTVNTPGSSTANPPITTVIPTPPPVAPAQPVPTVSEVSTRQPPVQVDIGAPSNGNQQHQQQQQSPPLARNGPQQSAPESASAPTQSPSQAEQTALSDPPPSAPPAMEVASTGASESATSHTQPTINSALREVARQNNEELVPVGGGNTSSPGRSTAVPQTTSRTTVTSSNPANSSSTSVTTSGMTKYTAAEGDTVSKMASRFLGGNTKENRALIVAANPSLQANPDKIIVGRSYNIPKPGAIIVQPAPVANSSPSSASRSTPANNTGEIWYTIKEGDTLSRIAQEQCGTVGAVQAIIELNPETLSDPNNIVVNTRIRLPSKQVAAVN
jgi:hypothetical protein